MRIAHIIPLFNISNIFIWHVKQPSNAAAAQHKTANVHTSIFDKCINIYKCYSRAHTHLTSYVVMVLVPTRQRYFNSKVYSIYKCIFVLDALSNAYIANSHAVTLLRNIHLNLNHTQTPHRAIHKKKIKWVKSTRIHTP